MRNIGSDAWSVDDIVESELVNERAKLEEQGQRLYVGIELAQAAKDAPFRCE